MSNHSHSALASVSTVVGHSSNLLFKNLVTRESVTVRLAVMKALFASTAA